MLIKLLLDFTDYNEQSGLHDSEISSFRFAERHIIATPRYLIECWER